MGTFGVDANGEAASGMDHEGERTKATPRGGAPRSSDEVRESGRSQGDACSGAKSGRPTSDGRSLKDKAKPHSITRMEVLDAYFKVDGIPTRKASARWERSTVWAVLRNSAYRGLACFGKTRASSRTRVVRPQRRRGVITPSMTAGHERRREEWIEIPVPALVSEDSFARAQELLRANFQMVDLRRKMESGRYL